MNYNAIIITRKISKLNTHQKLSFVLIAVAICSVILFIQSSYSIQNNLIAVTDTNNASTINLKSNTNSIDNYEVNGDNTSETIDSTHVSSILDATTCPIPVAEARPVQPAIIASYPGSGAKLTWKLIRAVTGLMTGDDYDFNGLASKGLTIAIKTHFPVINDQEDFFKPLQNVPNSILLIRNPLDAIPSHHNFIYEQSVNKSLNHAIRAPIEEWIMWRDKNFDIQLQKWVKQVNFWMSHHTEQNRMVASFEALIDETSGPALLLRIANFLMMPNHLDLPVPIYNIPCIWEKLVKIRIDEGTRQSSLRQGDGSRPYEKGQLQTLKSELERLKQTWPGQLDNEIDAYLVRITNMLYW